MAVKFANNVSTTLSSAINATQTTISVADASGLPTLSSGDYVYLTIDTDTASPTLEVVKVTAISSNSLTVVRGQDGTTASSFSSGTKVELRVTAAALDDISSAADTESVSIDGDTMTGDLTVPNIRTGQGSAASPAIQVGDNNSGFYDSGGDRVGVALGGYLEYDFRTTELNLQSNNLVTSGAVITGAGSAASPAIGVGDNNSGFYDSGANEIGVTLDGVLEYEFTPTQFNMAANNLVTSGTLSSGAITSSGNITSGNDVCVPNGRFFRFTAASSNSSGGFLFGNSSGTGGSITFKRNSDSAAVLTLNADQSATFAGTISSGAITSSASVIASGNSNSFGNTTISALTVTSVTASGSITASGNSNSFGNTTVGTLTSGAITSSDHISLPDSKYLRLGNDNDFIIYHDGATNYIQTVKQDSDLVIRGNDGGTNFNALTIDMSAGGNATFAGTINSGAITSTGNMSLSNSGTGNNITISRTDSSTSAVFQIGRSRGHVGTTTDHEFEIRQNGTPAITIDTAGNTTVEYNLVVDGNLTVSGTTTTLNTATLDVEDKNITLNYSTGDSSASANGAGITIQDAVSSSTDATILWDATNDEFDFSHPVNVTGQSTFTGSSTANNEYAAQFKNSAGSTILRARNDGRVLIPSGYLYAQHSEGIYSTGSIKARGGITNDGGNNLSISSGGSDITFNSKNFTSVGTISSGASYQQWQHQRRVRSCKR